MTPLKQPQRTRISCRSSSEKRELIRIVRALPGVAVDLTGKRPGRGAYLCRAADCWDAALKKGRLDSALRTQVSAADRQRLGEFAAALRAAGVL